LARTAWIVAVCPAEDKPDVNNFVLDVKKTASTFNIESSDSITVPYLLKKHRLGHN